MYDISDASVTVYPNSSVTTVENRGRFYLDSSFFELSYNHIHTGSSSECFLMLLSLTCAGRAGGGGAECAQGVARL